MLVIIGVFPGNKGQVSHLVQCRVSHSMQDFKTEASHLSDMQDRLLFKMNNTTWRNTLLHIPPGGAGITDAIFWNSV